MKYVAESGGFPTLNAACKAGLGWMCNTQWANAPSTSVLEVRLSKLNDPLDSDMPNDSLTPGDRVARNWFNFLALVKEGSPMPSLSKVVVTTARDGWVGSYGSVASAKAVGAMISVANGVGLNYDLMKDVWQAAGLRVEDAEDATGADRSPALESTWVVVSQNLGPGTEVPAGSSITATIRKYTDDSSSSAPSAAAKITVPNGVGLNYQKAQDLWRAAGLVVARAHDATGANRIPVIDSNWVVVSQDLKPGTKVPSGSTITATVKKYTD